MKYTLSILTFCFVLAANSQNITFRSLRAADHQFEKFSYVNAAKLYLSSLEEADDSLYIYKQLSLCYKNTNDPIQAEKYLEKVVSYETDEPRFTYLYAQTLASNGKYAEAKEWYSNYQNEVKNDPRAADKLDALENLNNFFSDSSKFAIQRMEFNSPGLDFSPAIYQEGIVFASSRPVGNNWVKTNFNWDESRFLDLYQVKPGSDQAELFIDHIQTKYHEGPLAFYENENKVVFTRNNIEGKKLKRDNEGVTRLKLFFAESDGNEGWKNIQPFEYNNDDYSVGHPAINKEGTVMIFSSDMEGGFGESDLYIVFKENDKWSQPKNLGERINTAGKEMFPSLVSSNLYFASDGRGGLGGLDIFEANLNNLYEVVRVNNIGYPINSSKDDFGLVSNDNFRTGYFSSARIDSLKDDIYFFERDYYTLQGLALDANTDKPIEGVDVFIQNNDGELIYRRSDAEGLFIIEDIDPNKWSVSGVKNSYELSEEQNVAIVEGDQELAKVQLYFDLNVEENFPVSIQEFINNNPVTTGISESSGSIDSSEDAFTINTIYYDFDKHSLRVKGKEELDKLIVFMSQNPNLIVALSSYTDSRGPTEYNLLLSQRRANEAFEYLIENGIDAERLQPTGYGESHPAVSCDPCSLNQHQENRRTNFILIGRKK